MSQFYILHGRIPSGQTSYVHVTHKYLSISNMPFPNFPVDYTQLKGELFYWKRGFKAIIHNQPRKITRKYLRLGQM